MIEIIRIPIKFHKSISRLSIEEKAYVFTGLFALSNDENYLIRDDAIGDMLTLIQFENTKMSAKAISKKGKVDNSELAPMVQPMGIPYGAQSSAPMVVPKEKEKEKEKEKDIGKQYKYFNEYMNLPENQSKLTYKLLVSFFDLGYVPAHEETTVSFRRWFEDIMKLHGISDEQEIEILINGFHTYWKESGKKIKNFKSTFSNNPLLSNKK